MEGWRERYGGREERGEREWGMEESREEREGGVEESKTEWQKRGASTEIEAMWEIETGM